jgi:hypothetical protein
MFFWFQRRRTETITCRSQVYFLMQLVLSYSNFCQVFSPFFHQVKMRQPQHVCCVSSIQPKYFCLMYFIHSTPFFHQVKTRQPRQVYLIIHAFFTYIIRWQTCRLYSLQHPFATIESLSHTIATTTRLR